MTDLRSFRDSLHGLTGQAFLVKRNALIGMRLEALALKEFKTSTDPYGNAWKPVDRRAKRGGPGKPLVKTGALRASHVSSGGVDGVRLGFADPVAIYAQKGTRPKLRSARAARQNRRGRFVNAAAKTAFLLRIREHTHPGVARRQILPESTTGGLPASWQEEIRKVVRSTAKMQIGGGR